MNPIVLPVAAIVVMLWIIWADSIRRRPAPRFFYFMRVVLFLVMTGLLVWNIYLGAYPGSVRYIAMAAAVAGLIGVVYFIRRVLHPPRP